MQKVELKVRALSHSNKQNGAYALILTEKNGGRDIPVIIGTHEAQAIALALENTVNPPRPLTHDLFKNFALAFQIKVIEVVIHDIRDGVFFATLFCTQGTQKITLDSRPSDAVAIALRFGANIFTTEDVLKKVGLSESEIKAGSLVDEVEETKPFVGKKGYSIEDATMDELNDLMKKSIAEENYEMAARVRDEIENRAK